MNFGQAFEELKQGNAVHRTGWNGPGQFVYYVPAKEYAVVTEIAKSLIGDSVPYGAYLALKNAQNIVVPWVPSMGDLMAEDWIVFPKPST